MQKLDKVDIESANCTKQQIRCLKSLIAQLDFGSNLNSEVFNALIANFKRGVV